MEWTGELTFNNKERAGCEIKPWLTCQKERASIVAILISCESVTR